MASHVYPTITSQTPPTEDEADDNGGFPRPDKDEQHLPVERMLGYAPKKKRIWLRVLVVVVVAAALAAAGYFAAKHIHFPSKKAAPVSSQKAETLTSQPTALKQYTSSNFNLGFSYPETWGVVDNGAGKLTTTSPVLQLKNAAGRTVAARAVVTIQNKQTSLPDFKAGNAVAAIASQKVSYTKPTSNQRAQTYISFLNYASSATKGVDGIYVTGDNGYQLGQAVPQTDVVQTDPLVTVTFLHCADAACSSGGAPLTLATGDWDGSFSTPILAIITSLSIQ